MKTLDIMKRAGRNLRQAKGRTILTSLAIAVGSFTLTMSLAAGTGARDYANKLINSNVSSQMVMVTKDKSASTSDGFSGGAGLKEYSDDIGTSYGVTMKMITQADIDMLAKRNDVKSVAPYYNLTTKYIQVEGSSKKYAAQVSSYDSGRQYQVAAGTIPPTGDGLAADDATVPDSYASTLGVTPEALLGKHITITAVQTPNVDEAKLKAVLATGDFDAVKALTAPQTFERTVKIVAVISKGMAIGAGSATNGVAISEPLARDIAELSTKGTDSYQKYYAAIVTAKDGVNPETLKAEVEAKGYGAQTAKDVQGILFTVVNVIQGIVTFFGILALLASVFGIVNTQYISVLERTSQIGLMKALGMSRRSISKLFRYEAAWIGFIGGVIGAVLAIVVGVLLNPYLTKLMSLGEGNYLLVFVWWHILLLLAVLVLIAVVAGWFPARKAARLDPIEALRTE
jgi:putative ABC transport system permease protein